MAGLRAISATASSSPCPETVPFDILPEDRGLILADSFGAAILREPPCAIPSRGARRKAVTLRFAHGGRGRCTASPIRRRAGRAL